VAFYCSVERSTAKLIFMIHPSAIIHPSAMVADDVIIEAFVVIEERVMVGQGSKLKTGTVLRSGTRVGANCTLGPYVVVGGEPMDTRFKGEESLAVLEDNVTLCEFATVHRATGEGHETRIGANTLGMCYVHVSHNAKVGQHAILTNSTQLAGHTEVGDYAVLGAGVMLHQFCRIGAYSIIAATTASNQDILPYSMAYGNPAQHYRLNKVGLQRRGIAGERYKRLEKAIRAFRRKEWEILNELAEQSDDVKEMLAFKESSKRGLCAFVG
jgi:UDP-N-acetylglucosamine acyltransferase